jgi:radical SAM-linked protein
LAKRQPEGPAPAPAVQRLRLRYAKRGRLRFSSHRDFQRAFERALRRAAVPMAYSAGFSPHPKVSYAGAAPTGVASEAEYVEIALAQRCDPERLRAALDRSLPPDLDVLELVEARGGSLADRLQASVWEVRLPGVPVEVAEAAVAAFLAAPRVEVSRMTKNGLRTFDARAAVLSLVVLRPPPGAVQRAAAEPAQECAILQTVVQHLTPAVRPDDVLAGLRQTGALAPPVTPAVTRLAQGPYDATSGAVSDPLAPDKDTIDRLPSA